MALFGAKRRRTREIAHEILKPLGQDLHTLKEGSRIDFEAQMRSVVDRNAEDELYNRQNKWQRGEIP